MKMSLMDCFGKSNLPPNPSPNAIVEPKFQPVRANIIVQPNPALFLSVSLSPTSHQTTAFSLQSPMRQPNLNWNNHPAYSNITITNEEPAALLVRWVGCGGGVSFGP